MSWRRVLIAALVAGSLGSFWWTWVVKGAPRRALAKQDADLALPGLKGQSVLELQARSGLAAPLILRFENARWRVLSPVVLDADSVQAEALGEQLRNVKKIQVVAGKEAVLKEYGLDQPNTLFSFTPISGATRVLLVGALNPTGQYLYAREKDGVEVFMIDKDISKAMLRGAEEYRIKSLWDFDNRVVQRVSSDLGQAWSLRQNASGTWLLSSPKEKKADLALVNSFFSQIKVLRLNKVVDEKPKDLNKWGLGSKSKRVELWLKGQAKPLWLKRGAKATTADGDGYYYQVSTQPFVFSMAAWTNNIVETRADQLVLSPTPIPEKP